MTRIILLDLEDIIAGRFDAQLPRNWRYTVICSYMCALVKPERLQDIVYLCWVDATVPFPPDVRQTEGDDFSYANERVYPEKYEFVGVCVATALPPTDATRDALHEYLFYEALHKRWTRYYSLRGEISATEKITSPRLYVVGHEVDDHDALPAYSAEP